MSEKKITFEDGDSYDRMMGVWSQLLGEQFIKWLNPPSGQSWIDIGCGTGAFTAQIAELCSPKQLLGIDPAEAQIEFARKRGMQQSAILQTGDAMALPCNAASLDIAVMALVLFFVPNPVLGLAEMKRVVRPGGIVAAYVWDVFGEGLPIQMFHKEFRKRGIEYPLPPSAEVSKMERLEELWNEADLRSVESTQIKASRKFGNFEEFWNVNTSSPALSVVLEDLSQQEISEIRSSLENQLPPDTSGCIVCQAHANAIKCIV